MARSTKLNTVDTLTKGQAMAQIDSGYQTGLLNTKRALEKCKKIPVSIPKHYRSVLGSELPLIINGVVRTIPVDGSRHDLEEPYVQLLENSLNTIQAQDVKDELHRQMKEAGFGTWD